MPEGHERPPWQQAYADLRDNTLDRAQRAFAWQLLHAALVPRAARVAHDDRLGTTEGVCTHPHCVRVPETITHVLLACPLAVSVITWLRDLWDAVTGGGNRPPHTVAVLLGDDQRTWQPRDAGLWMRLRIATLHALWMAAWKRARDGTPTNPASVAAKVVYGGRGSMQEDWCRVEGDVRLCSRAPIDWFCGRDSGLTSEQFVSRWGLGGVLASCGHGCVRSGALGDPVVTGPPHTFAAVRKPLVACFGGDQRFVQPPLCNIFWLVCIAFAAAA